MTANVAYGLPPMYMPHHRAPSFDNELPAYSRRTRGAPPSRPTASRDATMHNFELLTSKSRPWVTLRLASSARNSQSMPTFYEDEAIAGSVVLDLEKEDAIQTISLTVRGRIVTGAGSGDSQTFVSYNQPLWSKTMGDIGSPSSASEFRAGKLIGKYSWPFSFKLPKKVTIQPTAAEAPCTYCLPQTFTEKFVGASIQYDLLVTISRGKLRSDSHIQTMIAYVPSSKPSPPSMLRQLAYQEGSPLLPPDTDPEGWFMPRSVRSQGMVFSARNVEISTSLSLANPLTYTRGTVIPLFLTIKCTDPQALDLLAMPASIPVRLRRCVKYHLAPSQATAGRQSGAEWKETVDYIENAVWWPAARDMHDPTVRRLNGEIRLAKDLKPTTSIAHFTVDYSVVMLPFQAVGFASKRSEPLLSQAVEIATLHSRGPRVKAMAPPAYLPITRDGDDAPPLTPSRSAMTMYGFNF